MKLVMLATCCALLASPAAAQNVLDTLNRALGGAQQETRQDRGGDYRGAAEEDGRLPRDAQGRVDVRAMDDRQLADYQDRLERRGRHIAQELEVTEDEMRRRNLSRR